MVELSDDGKYWNVNTAGIFKTSYGANRDVVYSRHTTAKQPAEATEESLSEEQRGTTSLTRMSSTTQPITVSDSKGSEEAMKRQTGREDGQLLMLPSVEEEVGALPARTLSLSSADKGSESGENVQGNGEKINEGSQTGKTQVQIL